MSLIRRVNDQTSDTVWRPIPTGPLFRFHIYATPEIKWVEGRYPGYKAKFPLMLTPEEQTRVLEEYGQPPEGEQQSTLTSYMTGLSLGFMKNGQYKSTKLSDFLAPCLGQANMKRFIDWLIDGGGPAKPDDPEDPEQEIESFKSFLGWFEGLEVYGSIRHEEDAQGTIWARYGGPLAVGSLPGQREEAYQAIGLGKLRSMIAEWEASVGKVTKRQPVAAAAPAKKRSYEEAFPPEDKDDAPF